MRRQSYSWRGRLQRDASSHADTSNDRRAKHARPRRPAARTRLSLAARSGRSRCLDVRRRDRRPASRRPRV